ncbi:MAG TPA: AMP-binding protein, partial [Polyangiaceae bacterium]|nr:AMP-binding protein [Polyangiaceae bacterium]
RVAIPDGDEAKDPARLGRLVDRHGVAALQTVPTLAQALVEARREGKVSPLPTLRAVTCAGAALTRAVCEGFRGAFAADLANHYGPTEATVDATRFETDRPFDGDVVPIGRPLPNGCVYVLDANLRPTPPGVPGQIFLAGPGLARGYLRAPGLTAGCFLPNPFSPEPGARMYASGDLGKVDVDGTIYFLGRVDRQVKVRGNRVELGEIETRLAAHPAVRHVAVRHHRDHGDDCLVAHVELRAAGHTFVASGRPYRAVTLAQRPDLKGAVDRAHAGAWPDFFEGDATVRTLWPRLASEFARYQFALLDEGGRVAAAGNAVPIAWTGDDADLPVGWDAALERAFDDAERGAPADALVVLAAVVADGFAGAGLSEAVLRAFKAYARAFGIGRVVVPVRPTGKAARPDVSFDAWCARRRDDGLPEDPWIRAHVRLGGRALRVEHRSQYVRGTVADWERWTKRTFERSGEYHVPGALQPVSLRLEDDVGEYWDPSLWVEHPLDAGPSDELDYVDARALQSRLRAELPEYMVPEHVRFVAAMPLMSNGKIDEKALPEFRPGADDAGRAIVPPRTPFQSEAVRIWRELLATDRVGVTDDFFALGGQSMLAIRMLARLREALGVEVSLKDLYRRPTIRELESLTP